MPKGKGKGMNSPVGMYSYKDNPMKQPSRVPVGGNSSNPDAQKANRLLMKAHNQIDSLRGKSGL